MVVVDVLLAANLAVLAVLVVTDRSRSRRARPAEILAVARQVPLRDGTARGASGPGISGSCGVVIPFDRSRRQVASDHGSPAHPVFGNPAGFGRRH